VISELSRDNPRLIELTEAYAKLNLFEQSVWKDWANNIDITKFRGEIGYMAQMWSMTPERYHNTFNYLASIGLEKELARLGEDGAFGAVTFDVDHGASEDDITISRDLIDSAVEIKFLRDALDLHDGSAGTVLDIGAGYGRFAHRFLRTFPESMVYSTDGIPLSTFVCEYYLKYRLRQGKYRYDVVSLDRIVNAEPFMNRIHLATNMQSFSEMPLSAVDFWLGLCAAMDIRYFFLEPHSADLIHPHYVTSEPGGGNKDYYPLFEKYGYKLKVQQPKFPRDLAPSLIYSTDFLLFERG
jgi:SAM-dependent methyltransferase